MQLAEKVYGYVNFILHILTKFHDDDVIHTKIMAILSTSTSGISIFSVSDLNIWPEYLIWHGLLTEVIKISNFSILPIPLFSFVCLLFAFCSNFDISRYKMFTDGKV